MQDEFNQRKQKFKDKSDFIALNSTYKVIKNSFDDVKTMISELEDSKAIRTKMQEYTRNLIEKEEYSKSLELHNRVKHMKTLQDEAARYAEKKRIIQAKLEETAETGKRIKDEIDELDLKARVLRAKKKMLLKENKLLTDQAVTISNDTIENQNDLIALLKEKDEEELKRLEGLQTRFYHETVKMVNL